MNVKELKKDRTTRKGWIRKLDKLMSQLVIKREPRCVTCGTDKKLTCGHLFSRVAYSTRWTKANCHTQCLSCNFRHEHDAYPYTRWFLKTYGETSYDALHLMYETPVQYKTYQLKELYEELKSKGL